MNELSLVRVAKELLTIEENFQFYVRGNMREFALDIFTQVWGSSSGGFSGVGCSAMTSMQTYVFSSLTDSLCYVFFGGRYAYCVEADDAFCEDLKNRNLRGCWECRKYYKVLEVVE